MADIDERGSFYLGRRHDLETGKTGDAPLLYDSANLTTHAVCVGMTGSGKTGLCLALLEEAALDGIPAIAIDPKGDLGNLMLTFPELRGSDFRPWIDESVAARDGETPDALAERTANGWRDGLQKWGEDGERIRRFKNAVDCAIYTPGSSAGLPLTVLKSFNAPPQAVLDDADAFGDRVQSAASGVLALLGVNADPVNSREHILLSKVLETAWRAGHNLTLADIIQEIQKPSFRMVGAVPLDSFLASKDRDALAMMLNNLLASPSFASWLEGEPLDIEHLLYTTDAAGAKKPRLSILSIAHLGDDERMFFVTLLLNELISWMRSQPGTSSLRAILYMDEVFGFFPPSANPPAKKPMLTLLKQARAYGVGCVLATQNPVDLDYKGLSNAGTWFLGRLQTERDKMRVIEGLEGASAEAGAIFNRGEMERALAGLGKRVFLMNNVHDRAPTVFASRWALSYLAGPLTRKQISTLMADRKRTASAPAPFSRDAVAERGDSVGRTSPEREAPERAAPSETRASRPAPSASSPPRPLLSGEVTQRFWPPSEGNGRDSDADAQITYRPALLGTGRIHYVQSATKVDVWRTVAALKLIDGDLSQTPWDAATVLNEPPQLVDDPTTDAAFADLPGALGQLKTYLSLKRELADWLYQTQRFRRYTCDELAESSQPEETEDDFRRRAAPLLQAARRTNIAEQLAIETKRIEKEIEEAEAARAANRWWFLTLLFNVVARLVEIVVTGLLSRRSRKQVVTASLWNQAMKTRAAAVKAKKILDERHVELEQLTMGAQDELKQLEAPLAPAAVPLTKVDVPPRKSDVDVDEVLLAWLPWRTPQDATPIPAYKLP